MSSSAVGWALFEEGVLVEAGAFPPAGSCHPEKLLGFARTLAQLFRETEPHQVAYEAPYPGRNRNAFRVLSWYIGVLLAAYWAHFGTDIPTENAVQAHLVKKTLKMPRGQDHSDNKLLAVQEVNRKYGLDLDVTENDKADAIQLGRAWLLRNRPHLTEVVA